MKLSQIGGTTYKGTVAKTAVWGVKFNYDGDRKNSLLADLSGLALIH